MEEWHKKELSFQGTHKLSSYIKDELQIINKSMLDDFTSHITVAGATFFNKCWSTAVLFSRLLEREHQFKNPGFTRILPHPLFLLLCRTPDTENYILANKKSLIVPQNEYVSLYSDLKSKDGSYNIPKYALARSYLTILLDLIRWFAITNQTTLLTYDNINNCITLGVSCLRQGKCSNYLPLLYLNSDLENQLSKIVGNCSFNTFKHRCQYSSMDDFMQTTFFNQSPNQCDNDKYDEYKRVVENEPPFECRETIEINITKEGTSGNSEQTSGRVEKYIVALVDHPKNIETIDVPDNSSKDVETVGVLDNSNIISIFPPNANYDGNNTSVDDLELVTEFTSIDEEEETNNEDQHSITVDTDAEGNNNVTETESGYKFITNEDDEETNDGVDGNNIESDNQIQGNNDNEPTAVTLVVGIIKKKPPTITIPTNKRKYKLKKPYVKKTRQCFINTTMLKNLEQYVDKKWPLGNDKKDDFCQGMRRVLDMTSDSKVKTNTFITCHEEPITEDINGILEIVQQKFPSKYEMVKKALIGGDF